MMRNRGNEVFFLVKHVSSHFLQIKLQYRDEERVANVLERQSVKRLLGFMLDIPWSGSHDHNGPCRHCQMIAMWFQLAHSLMDRIFPQQRCVLNSDKEARTFASVTFAIGGSVKSASGNTF